MKQLRVIARRSYRRMIIGALALTVCTAFGAIIFGWRADVERLSSELRHTQAHVNSLEGDLSTSQQELVISRTTLATQRRQLELAIAQIRALSIALVQARFDQTSSQSQIDQLQAQARKAQQCLDDIYLGLSC